MHPACAAIVAAALAGCVFRGGGMGGGPRSEASDAVQEPPLRVWAAPIVRWDGDAARDVEFAVENTTNRTIPIAPPDPARARVQVFSRPDGARLCGVDGAALGAGAARGGGPSGDGAGASRIDLAPGDRIAVRVDLGDACGSVPAGEYRYEIEYRVAAPGDGGMAGMLGARVGELIVADGVARAEPDRNAPRRSARTPPRP